MNTLRWTLGVIAVLFSGGFVILVLMANGFRKSFGASESGPLFIALPVIGMLLLLGGIMFPFSKPLLHIAAVAAVGLVGFCLWQIFSESAVPLWFAIAYLIAWFVYYWLAAWRAVPQP
jgi:hypothetical protein